VAVGLVNKKCKDDAWSDITPRTIEDQSEDTM